MLLRLRVDGFKNLDAVEVRFGTFTCIAGPNGVGKSNLFDAIRFLSALANGTLVDAAKGVRGGGGETGDLRSLFRRVGDEVAQTMSFEADLLLPRSGKDFINQDTVASSTLVTYRLVLRRLDAPDPSAAGPVVIEHESLVAVPQTRARRVIGFPASDPWLERVLEHRSGTFIRTQNEGREAVVHLHNDSNVGKGRGRPARALAWSLTSTLLSSANLGADHRTLVLVRREMAGWTQLQLEPSALRRPDSTFTRAGVGPDGSHLPVTLWSLLRDADQASPGSAADVRARLASRLSRLTGDVRDLRVDVDERRNLVTLVSTDLSGTDHEAAVLSDGTLRFVALALLQESGAGPSVLCLEEPENGIHPARIPEMVRLLEDYAVETGQDAPEAPLRQVIVNTHSPSVVACVEDPALLIARAPGTFRQRLGQPAIQFLPLKRTWRTRLDPGLPTAGRDELAAYLDPLQVAAVRIDEGSLSEGPRVVRLRGEYQLDLFAAETRT